MELLADMIATYKIMSFQATNTLRSVSMKLLYLNYNGETLAPSAHPSSVSRSKFTKEKSKPH